MNTNYHIELFDDQLKIKINQQVIQLTYIEYRLIGILVKHQGRIYSREQLLDMIHQEPRDVTDRTIDTLIKVIRKKFRQVIGDFKLIHSVYGLGYKFEA